MEVKEIIAQHEEKMDKTIEALKRELSSIRTGRASTSLLDRITVDYYGTPTPVKQVANVSVPEPRMITIAPWEPKMLGEIEKAILKSDLGLNPNNDGKIIRLEIPQLTEERLAQLRQLQAIAQDRGQTLAQLALCWILRQKAVTSVLVGASRPEQITDTLQIVGQKPLTDEELRAVDAAVGL